MKCGVKYVRFENGWTIPLPPMAHWFKGIERRSTAPSRPTQMSFDYYAIRLLIWYARNSGRDLEVYVSVEKHRNRIIEKRVVITRSGEGYQFRFGRTLQPFAVSLFAMTRRGKGTRRNPRLKIGIYTYHYIWREFIEMCRIWFDRDAHARLLLKTGTRLHAKDFPQPIVELQKQITDNKRAIYE